MDKNSVYFDVDVNYKSIQNKVDNLLDDNTMVAIHNLFAKIIYPWVPRDEGLLAQDIEVTPNYLRYKQPYAHYQYVGIVYAPNIPIMENGIIVGWRSPPGKGTKHPTDRKLGTPGTLEDKDGNVIWEFGYTSPNSSSEWDKAAMQTQLDKFIQGVKNILVRRAKELYG